LGNLGTEGMIILKWIFGEVQCEDVDWIQPASDMAQWQTFMTLVRISERENEMLCYGIRRLYVFFKANVCMAFLVPHLCRASL
jgi:hypothetical protein